MFAEKKTTAIPAAELIRVGTTAVPTLDHGLQGFLTG